METLQAHQALEPNFWNHKRVRRVYKAMGLDLRRPPTRKRISKRQHVSQKICAEHRLPEVLPTDNGPEFRGDAFVQWAKAHHMAIRYIQPGKPNQNAYIERFNRTCREEVLDQHLFVRLQDVREATWWWMLGYNEQRLHDSLQDVNPK